MSKKICPTCGMKNSRTAGFCCSCGSTLDNSRNVKSGATNVALIIILVILVIAMIGEVLYLVFSQSSFVRNIIGKDRAGVEQEADADIEEADGDDGDEDAADDDDSLTAEAPAAEDESAEAPAAEEGPAEAPAAEEEPAEAPAAPSVTDDRFGINPNTVTDYANALYPEDYKYYDSGISDFSFYYAADLYNDVELIETGEEEDYGSLEQRVIFSGSDGSTLTYSLYKRRDTLPYDDVVNFIYDAEAKSLRAPSKILGKSESDYGKLILTGYDRYNIVYDLVKIKKKYIMQMVVSYPDTTDEEERNRMNYVVDCYYRMCGFSDASKSYRSYSEYKSEN